MPPRRSTRKLQKRFGQSLVQDGTGNTQTTNELRVGAQTNVIRREAPPLPPELLAYIMDCLLGDMITDDIVLANPTPQDLKSDLLTGYYALIALSQVSRSLRRFFLPIARKRLYACTISGKGAWYKEVADQLSLHSAMLVGNSHTASYVQ
jgi:hypothetical protein